MYTLLHKVRSYLPGVLLVLALLGVYGQVAHHPFVNYDDPAYITENAPVRAGLTGEGVRWAFSSVHDANWIPLTWMSHMADVELFGLNAGWHHLVSLLLHVINTLLLLRVLGQMTGKVWQSALVAALFALHPLHVESVAWASERKDLLSSQFWMLTILAYLRYVARPSLPSYLAVALAFACGLMAKPMLVTLPFVLLLLDYWPLRRLGGGETVSLHRCIAEKLPLLALTAVSSVVTYCAQKSDGAVAQLDGSTLPINVANALVSYLRYMAKAVWPADLAIFYPHPGAAIPGWQVVGAAAVLVAVSALVVYYGRRFPYLPVGWFWYAGTLVPVIGIVRVGSQAMADRYTYLPLIGLFILVVWGASDLMKRFPVRRDVPVLAAVAVLMALGWGSWRQAACWRSSIALFERAVAVTKDNALAYNMLGAALAEAGRNRDAVPQYREALRLEPSFVKAHYNLALAYSELGNTDGAIEQYRMALRLDPTDVDTLCNLGNAYATTGRYDEAIEHYLAALQIRPRDEIVWNNLTVACQRTGQSAVTVARNLIP